MTRFDWEANIDNSAAHVAEMYGNDVVASVFARYDATCFEDLSPSHYDEVFGDLLMIEDDN